MIIDAHVHVERKKDGAFYTPREIIAAMDAGGVDVSIVYGNDQGDAGARPAWAGDEIPVATEFSDEAVAAFCSEFPERLVGISSIHPDRYRPELKIRRAVEEFGLRGVKLYPHAGFYANDKRLYPVYEYCQKAGVPVIIHTGIKAVRWQHMKYNNPIYADDVATDFPGLNVIICHGGYPWTEEFFAVAGANPNVHADVSFLDYIERKFAVPGLTENTIKRLVALIGSTRLLWGSEGPFMNLPLYGAHGPENYKRSQDFLVRRFDFLSEADKQNILGENAGRLFLGK
ncbi:MAG: amidohydrolase family protein [Verrucomicrobia bacterium]|nr:amidohydrolase family protein [Verrucomicrobiota bacterium]